MEENEGIKEDKEKQLRRAILSIRKYFLSHFSSVFLLMFFLIFIGLILFFIIYLQRPVMGIFLFVVLGFFALLLFGKSTLWNSILHPKVLIYALFTELPIEENFNLPIRSILPIDCKLQYQKKEDQTESETYQRDRAEKKQTKYIRFK